MAVWIASTPLRMLSTMWRKKDPTSSADRRRASGGRGEASKAIESRARALDNSTGCSPHGANDMPGALSPDYVNGVFTHRPVVNGLPITVTVSFRRLVEIRFGSRLVVLLERLPLPHQVADFPHQRLVLVDHRLRSPWS